MLVESGGDLVVHAAFLFPPQFTRFCRGAGGEELFERARCEVVDLEMDSLTRGHVLAPHGGAEFVSGFVADADDAVTRSDESGRLVDGGIFDNRFVGAVAGARRAADPGFFGQ